MALAPHVHEHFEAHERRYGHPSSEYPLRVREAFIAEKLPVPQPFTILSVVTPPMAGSCHVCGVTTARDADLRAHAVAGFEQAKDDASNPLRLLVSHCREHARADHCSRDKTTPGSGILDAPGGFCEPLTRVQELGGAIIPGAPYLGKFLRYAFVVAGGLFLSQLAVVTSRGQQQADFQGPVTSMLYPADSTLGHGFNTGGLRILSGSAPATADAAETGTLLINWAMPNPAFGAPSAATPTASTAAAISNVSASATNTAGYGRLVENADTFGSSTTLRRFQFTVGAGSGDMSFNTLSIVSGGTCSCTSLSLTHG